MKKNLAMVLGCWFLVLLSGSVFADEGLYVSAKVGAVFAKDADSDFADPALGSFEIKYETGFSGEGAIGYDFGLVRLEGEVGYRLSDIDTIGGSRANSDVSVWSGMFNAYVDFEFDGSFEPYLGGGIGSANVDADGAINDSDGALAYQFGAGIGIKLPEKVVLDVGYRYFTTPDVELSIGGNLFDTEYESHNVYVGLRFNVI